MDSMQDSRVALFDSKKYSTFLQTNILCIQVSMTFLSKNDFSWPQESSLPHRKPNLSYDWKMVVDFVAIPSTMPLLLS